MSFCFFKCYFFPILCRLLTFATASKEQIEKAEEKERLEKEKEETKNIAENKDEARNKSDDDQKEGSSFGDDKIEPSDESSLDKVSLYRLLYSLLLVNAH